jgi:cysteine desulfurase
MASAEISRVYLDYNATAPLRPEARAATLEALDALGNPSSIHAEGRRARAIVEEARRSVAALAGVEPRGVVFVSGGTEAANLALTPAIQATGRKTPLTRLIMSAGEHPCVLRGHRFAPEAVAIAPLQADGRLDLDALAEILSRGAGAPMLALQGANNETGVLQPVAEAAALVHAAGGVVVCDGVQLPGRIDLAAATSGADFLFLSAHKLGGPKGAGALVAMRPDLTIEAPLLRGGGQERGARAGTENVASIAGFGAAARLAAAELDREPTRLAALRDRLARRLRETAPEAVAFGAAAPRLPNTLAFAAPGAAAATLLIALDLAGVAVSSGSACSSGKVTSSHVLAAMGIEPGLAAGAIRVSVGWASRDEDVDRFVAALGEALAGLRRRRAGA